jgi:hypothetical protein
MSFKVKPYVRKRVTLGADLRALLHAIGRNRYQHCSGS